MFAIGYNQKKGLVDFEIDKPKIIIGDQVLIKVIEVGIDGTDHSILEEKLWDPPPGAENWILGHEMLGRVEEVGSEVSTLKPGDLVVPTVRRGCGICNSCRNNQSDMCTTGLYKERGIHQLDGFFTEYILETEQYIAKVPDELSDLAVLIEPLSIVYKAYLQIQMIQQRFPWACEHINHRFGTEEWGHCKKALVIGIGPLGFLGVLLFSSYMVDVYAGINRPEKNIRVKLIKEVGARYIDTRKANPKEIAEAIGEVDIILEATGVANLVLELSQALGRNGIFVFTGIPRGSKNLCLDGNFMLQQLVRKNQVMIGTVNSNREHFKQSIEFMSELQKKYPSVLKKMITRVPKEKYEEVFFQKSDDVLKVVLTFN